MAMGASDPATHPTKTEGKVIFMKDNKIDVTQEDPLIHIMKV